MGSESFPSGAERKTAAEPGQTNLTVPESVSGVSYDVYSGFQLLGEQRVQNVSQIEQAMQELSESFHPHLLRITEAGDTYRIQVYDFP